MHFSITDFLADIVENSINAGSQQTQVSIIQDERNVTMTVVDTGKGMTEEELSRARDPFTTDGKKHPGRKVGLGIPFLVQALAMTDGDFDIRSCPGKGTTVRFRFDLHHLDTPPLGNLSQTFRQILTLPGDHELVIDRSINGESYRVSRSEVIETLGEIESVGSQNLLLTYLASLEENGEF